MKARTALMQRGASKAVMNQVRQNPNTELQRIQLGMFANSGGLPVVINKQMIGVIGSGGPARRGGGWGDGSWGRKASERALGAGHVAPLVEDVAKPSTRHPPDPPPLRRSP